jgi:hypothetical protein
MAKTVVSCLLRILREIWGVPPTHCPLSTALILVWIYSRYCKRRLAERKGCFIGPVDFEITFIMNSDINLECWGTGNKRAKFPFRYFVIGSVDIRSRPYSWEDRISSPLTKWRQLSCACSQSLKSNSKHVVHRKYFISHVNAWEIQRKSFQSVCCRRHMYVNCLGRNWQSFRNSFQRGISVFLESWMNHRICFVSVRSSWASFVPEFFVARANLADSFEY